MNATNYFKKVFGSGLEGLFFRTSIHFFPFVSICFVWILSVAYSFISPSVNFSDTLKCVFVCVWFVPICSMCPKEYRKIVRMVFRNWTPLKKKINKICLHSLFPSTSNVFSINSDIFPISFSFQFGSKFFQSNLIDFSQSIKIFHWMIYIFLPTRLLCPNQFQPKRTPTKDMMKKRTIRKKDLFFVYLHRRILMNRPSTLNLNIFKLPLYLDILMSITSITYTFCLSVCAFELFGFILYLLLDPLFNIQFLDDFSSSGLPSHMEWSCALITSAHVHK